MSAVRMTFVGLVLTLAIAPAAGAGEIVHRAAQSLAGDPVYVDAAAKPTLTAGEEQRLENEIADLGEGPIYVAVLPAAAASEAGDDATAALRELADQLHRPGVYAIVAGGKFRAGATGDSGLQRGEAARLATDAFDEHRDEGLAPTLDGFVERVGIARTDERRAPGGGGDGGGGSFGFSPFWLLVAGALAFFGWRQLKRRRVATAELLEVKEAAREDLAALADDVTELEDDVERVPAAKRDYSAALEQYERASQSFDRARTPAQLEPVAQALEEGRYLMTSAKARLEGREPPERRPPCFFDPRHGPSVRDVSFTPPFGGPRDVPACAADAVRIEQGEEPQSRLVRSRGQLVPYWSAPGYFGGYFGGFLPGLLIGDLLLGGTHWGGPGFGQPGDGDLDDAGDFGSGDFGGGDFSGGGDFGGGDGGGGGDF